MSAADWTIFAIKAFFAIAVVFMVIVFVLVPLWRQLRSGPDIDLLNPQLPTFDEEGDELEIPAAGERGKPDRQTIIDRARNSDPRVTATLISNWLKQKN